MPSTPCDRRSFLAGTVLLPAAALVGVSPQETRREPPRPAKGVRITVLKRTQELALQERYLQGSGVIPPCGSLRDGQAFTSPAPYAEMPDGMCPSAWRHMQETVKFVDGGSLDRVVACCTDGYRPVFFLIERLV